MAESKPQICMCKIMLSFKERARENFYITVILKTRGKFNAYFYRQLDICPSCRNLDTVGRIIRCNNQNKSLNIYDKLKQIVIDKTVFYNCCGKL